MVVSFEGIIGAGKTTTVSLLRAEPEPARFFEAAAEHPFLAAFYSDMERYRLETELQFVLLHYHQFKDVPREGLSLVDFSPMKDLVFAEANLSGSDLELLCALHERTCGALPRPHLTIYLDVEVDLALWRIRNRGIPYETAIDQRYLQSLVEIYEKRMTELGEEVVRLCVSPTDSSADVCDAVTLLIRDATDGRDVASTVR